MVVEALQFLITGATGAERAGAGVAFCWMVSGNWPVGGGWPSTPQLGDSDYAGFWMQE